MSITEQDVALELEGQKIQFQKDIEDMILVADEMKEQEHLEFLKTIKTFVWEEYTDSVRDRILIICKTQTAYHKYKIALLEVNVLHRKIDFEIEQAKKSLEFYEGLKYKNDYESFGHCAFDMRKKLQFGKLESLEERTIVCAYKWAVKNCTINKNPIEHFRQLKKGYENAKVGALAPQIEDFEEKYYGVKP
tara:strand:+ start:3137 stop:3709 length:573 start_codon:yes stop_codon:yes gene_type:complete